MFTCSTLNMNKYIYIHTFTCTFVLKNQYKCIFTNINIWLYLKNKIYMY